MNFVTLTIFTFIASISGYTLKTTPFTPYYVNINVDQAPFNFNFADEDVNTIQFRVLTKSDHRRNHEIKYSIVKCGEMIFNATTSQVSDNIVEFGGPWVPKMLNGTCGSRELMFIVKSPVHTKVTVDFQKSILVKTPKTIGYPLFLNISTNGFQRVEFDGLQGLLELHESGSMDVFISSATGLSVKLGVCNSTFITINEPNCFERQFTSTELKALSLMRQIRCVSPIGDTTQFFIRNLKIDPSHLVFKAKFTKVPGNLGDEIVIP